MKYLVTLLIVVGGFALGCAHSLDKFYLPDGSLCAKVSSFVIGTGETEKYVVSPCGTVIMDTKDTGLSDNATELGGEVAEGLARGAVEGINPVP